jgi:hypothetical protein
VSVRLDGLLLGEPRQVVTDALATYTWDLPVNAPRGEFVTLTFTVDAALTPESIGLGADQRALALMVDWIRLSR